MIRLLRSSLVAGVFLYLYLPIAILVVNSFNSSKYGHTWKGFSLRWYEKLWGNEALMQAFTNSLLIATLAATAATVLGTLMALAVYRYRFRGRRLASGLLFVVMMSPDIVLAITFLVVFIALGIHLGFWSLLIAHTTLCLPFVVVTVFVQLNGFDKHLLEAARDLGAGEWRSFRHVTLPLVLPAVVAGWLLAFTLSLDDVIISTFVTGPGFEILPIRVYSMVKVGVSPEVNVLAALLLALSLLLAGLVAVIGRRYRIT